MNRVARWFIAKCRVILPDGRIIIIRIEEDLPVTNSVQCSSTAFRTTHMIQYSVQPLDPIERCATKPQDDHRFSDRFRASTTNNKRTKRSGPGTLLFCGIPFVGKYYYAGIINIKECMDGVVRDNNVRKEGVLWVVVQIKYNTAAFILCANK